MNQKIIFLDLDGVLTNIDLDQSSFEIADPEGYHLSKLNMKWLDMILEKTNAKIVIASNWRRFQEPHIYCLMRGAFYKSTLVDFYPLYSDYIIGTLPRLSGITKSEALQIWFIANNWLSRDAGKYVILEDDENEGYQEVDDFKNHLIITDKKLGLTAADASKAIKLLNS